VHPGVRLYTGDLPHVRYLKISEGCDHGCAFCAIPLMRGRHRSFALDDVVRETQLLELQGAREVNLVAQDLAHYGRDVRDGRGLPDLLTALVEETGIPWFRLLYIYSAGLTPRMLDLMAREPRIVRYLDIPMQHASDAVLERMRRPSARRDSAKSSARSARQSLESPSAPRSSSGSPVRRTTISSSSSTSWKKCSSTASAFSPTRPRKARGPFDLPDDVPDELKRERLERVTEVQRLVTAERYEGMIGLTVPAIVDRVMPDGSVQARTHGQADDIDGITWVRGTGDGVPPTPLHSGDLVEIQLDAVANDYDFEATLVRHVSAAPTQPKGGARTGTPRDVHGWRVRALTA
jgi:ribosomal protein S12 methylthiotransferase